MVRTYYSFIGHLLNVKVLIGSKMSLANAARSVSFLVSDVGPVQPESGDLSQHSANCQMKSFIIS